MKFYGGFFMRKSILFLGLFIMICSIASAQTPGYFLTFGNPDGSDIVVSIDMDLELPVWYASPAGNLADSVNFLHIALACNDSVISGHNGGFFMFPLSSWDDASFLGPSQDNNLPGYSYVGILGFADLGGGPNPFLNTNGDTIQIAAFRMHTANNLNFVGHGLCPFADGDQGAPNDGTIFGLQDGVTIVNPQTTYSCLYFSENQDPVWTVFPEGNVAADKGIEVCFALAGEDTDDDTLTISEITNYGTVIEYSDQPGQATAMFCAAFDTPGNYVVEFELNDGTVGIPLQVTVEVTPIGLVIGCPGAFPGIEVSVPVRLETASFETGGFEILISWDNTALTYLGIDPTERIDLGREYFHVNLNDGCSNCPDINRARVVWISDINNGRPHDPAPPGDDPIFYIRFEIEADLPFGMVIPVEFITEDYSDNAISDQSGYQFIHPDLTSGCVSLIDPNTFKGDPNMNCWLYEIGDAVLVARRVMDGFSVWGGNEENCYGLPPFDGDDELQEAAADLNNNSRVDIADLVTFISIINGIVDPPKLDPELAKASVSIPSVVGDNLEVTISSGLDVGGVLIDLKHPGIELGEPAVNNMDILWSDIDGEFRAVIYSLEGRSISAGESVFLTLPVVSNDGGSFEFSEVSVSDSYGRLLETTNFLQPAAPTEFSLKGSYPNPFNSTTVIEFSLPVRTDVDLTIYNVLGQAVRVISLESARPGVHKVEWSGVNDAGIAVSSGVYFYRLEAGAYKASSIMTLLK